MILKTGRKMQDSRQYFEKGGGKSDDVSCPKTQELHNQTENCVFAVDTHSDTRLHFTVQSEGQIC